ncbi:MAG TPA: hypothetical protein VH416_07420 [Gaiellaceae bacterium]
MRLGALLVAALAIAATTSLGALGASRTAPAPTPKTGAAPWPAPPNPMKLTRRAGLTPERYEHLRYHVHSHLDVFVNGKRVVIPAGIGIAIHDPAVHHGAIPDGSTAYGGINPPCAQACISPLHTHADLGLLHTESSTSRPNNLGEFFTEWNVRLDRRCVGGYCKPDSILVYVNGKRYSDDPREILLANHTEIAIVIGTPPKKIPSKFPGNVPI